MIIGTRKIAALAAVAVGLGIAAIQFSGDAEGARSVDAVAGGASDVASMRVAAAFELATEIPAPALRPAVSRKGDRLPTQCAGQAWPSVSAECLIFADSASAVRLPARTVTVEHRSGEATSVLVRMPVIQLAAR